MPKPVSIHENIPADVPFCYQAFLQFCPARKFPITGAEETSHKVYFTLPGYKTIFEALFESAGANTYMTVTYTDRLNFIPVLTNSVVEPFLAQVNAERSGKAQAVLAGNSPERVLRLDQPVAPEVEALLAALREGPSAYGRREAAEALGKLPESSQRITAALVMARETDPYDGVRSEATAALKLPAHQAVLDANPVWVEQLLALSHVRQAGVVAQEQETRKRSRAADGIITFGVIVAVIGAAALILPASGHYLSYLGITLKDPLWNAVILVAGLALTGWGIWRKRNS